MGCIGIADDGGGGTGFQRLLHGPQQADGFPEGNRHEAVARQAQPLEPVAIKPAIFPLMGTQSAPEQRTALLAVAQAAECERQREAHGGGLVAMGAGRNVMKPPAHQALRREMPVKLGQAGHPGGSLRPVAGKLRVPLFKPRDLRTQGLDQGCDMIALTEMSDAGASFPAPRTTMCRSCTHDCNDPECSLFVP